MELTSSSGPKAGSIAASARSLRLRRLRAGDLAGLIVLLIFSVVVLFPFYYMLISSLREPFYDFSHQVKLSLLPSAFNLGGYAFILDQKLFGPKGELPAIQTGYINSLILALALTVGSTFLNALSAYAFAKHDFPGRDLIFNTMMLTIILPGEVLLIPTYVMLFKVHLINTLWALILPGLTGIFGIFLMRQFMQTISDTFIEAARMDGANEWQVIWNVILPMSRPVLATYAIFTFLGGWNAFVGPLIFLDDPAHWTLQLVLYNTAGPSVWSYGATHWDLTGLRMQGVFAGQILGTLPAIIVFVIFQRQLIQGIQLTGLK